MADDIEITQTEETIDTNTAQPAPQAEQVFEQVPVQVLAQPDPHPEQALVQVPEQVFAQPDPHPVQALVHVPVQMPVQVPVQPRHSPVQPLRQSEPLLSVLLRLSQAVANASMAVSSASWTTF